MKQSLPTEAQEQEALFRWAEYQKNVFPELALLYHIPNGGSRDVREAHNLRMQGVKSGVPDLMLPVARRGYHGLFIEMKRLKGGRVSDEQNQWLALLKSEGYAACVCQGWAEAADYILWYLKG